jgi:hypothetical protein
MNKIYVFGIGGTGSRILRALTMLLASGVECSADVIVPVIIDPDAASGDVGRTVDLMKKYGEIRSKLDFDSRKKNRFFKTDIQQIMTNFRLPLSNTQDVKFGEYMNVSGMSRENQALVNMLFSQKNLASDMKIGFKGNPNVGSVVLNQFDESNEFLNFANEFNAQDKIFIISSIFGGTGASGFPLLLKTLRTSNKVANQQSVNNAHIGAITVLPYFQVKQDDDNSQIDSATFVSKSKSALAYYERAISNNNTIDALYYIADDTRTIYDNCEGGINQKNNAHFVELVSALALIDFADSTKSVAPANAIHKEYGIEIDANEIIFNNLGKMSKRKLCKAMTQFNLFSKYAEEAKESNFLKQPWAKDRALDKSFFDGDFISSLKQMQQDYLCWLNEMTTQQRAFKPFNLHKNANNVFDLVKGVRQKKKWWVLDKNYNLFDNRLNKQTGESKTGNKEQQFVELFYLATEQLVKEKFNIE